MLIILRTHCKVKRENVMYLSNETNKLPEIHAYLVKIVSPYLACLLKLFLHIVGSCHLLWSIVKCRFVVSKFPLPKKVLEDDV